MIVENINVLQYRTRVISKVSPYFSGETLLDSGCGDGKDAILMLKYFKKIEAIDIAQSTEWDSIKEEGLTFKKADGESLPYADNAFDTVIEKDMLHHAANPEKALAEMARVAKKRVIIIEANRYNPIFYLHLTLMGNHQHFNKTRFKQIIKSAGFNHEVKHFSARVCPVNNVKVIAQFDKVENFLEKFPLYSPFIEYNLGIISK